MAKYLKKIQGVFSEETTITLGTGHTQKTQRVKNYCMAEQLDEETVQISFLGNEGQPTGIVVKVPYDEFLTKYTFEPEFKIKTKEEREHDKHLSRAEKHRARNESFSAEMEYTSALKIDPESIKANFGIGTLYMEMGQKDKAKSVFQKLSHIDAIFEEDNKHIFNEFGIELRKARMAEEALSNYLKAFEISPHDENLCFKIARVYYDARDLEYADLWIQRSIATNPSFREAKLFASLINRDMINSAAGEASREGDNDSDSPRLDLPRVHPDSIKSAEASGEDTAAAGQDEQESTEEPPTEKP